MADSVISVDLDKAKDMFRDILRSAREPVLKELDIKFMRAVESGNTKLQKEISSQKQILRDVTKLPAIDSAQTTDDLRNAWPLDVFPPPSANT